MNKICFNPRMELKSDETLRLKDGVLYVEKKSYRQNRFFLIRLWTNSQYDENRILSRMLFLAQTVDHAAQKQFFLKAAEKLLLNLTPEMNQRNHLSSFMRWFKGTPCIQFSFFLKRIEILKREKKEPQPRPQPKPVTPKEDLEPKPNVPPVDVSNLSLDKEIPKETLIALMNESLTKCTAPAHIRTLKKWIKVTENQEDLLNETKRIYQMQWEKLGNEGAVTEEYMKKNFLHSSYHQMLDSYMANKTELLLHSDKNRAYTVISNAPQNYARAYLSVREKPEELAQFYKKVFKGFAGCLEGNDREIAEWFEKRIGDDLILLAPVEIKTKMQTFGDLDQLRIEFKMREYFKKLNQRDFKPKDANDEAFREKYLKNGTPEIVAFREAEETKEGLFKFIQESNRLPIKTTEGEITAENLQSSIDDYWMAVYGE